MKRTLRRWLASFRSFSHRLRWNMGYAWHSLGRLFASVLRHLRMLRQRQSIRYFFQALPALVLAAGVGVLLFMIWVDPPEQRVARYRQAGYQALLDNDATKAQVAYERLAILDESQPEYRFRLALIMQRQGDTEIAAARKEAAEKHEEEVRQHLRLADEQYNRVRAMMATLASPDKQGYGPAHYWWAAHLSQSKDPAALQLAEIHLRRALQINSDDVQSNELIGRLYLSTGRLKDAETHFKKAVGARPDLDLLLAETYRRMGTKDLARLHAEKAQRYFRQQAQADVDNHLARLRWAQATIFVEDYPAAVGILQEGLRLSQAAAYRPALSQAYVSWADMQARNPKSTVAERLALLEKAIAFDFSNLEALTRLADLTRTSDEASADKARAALRGLLAEGKHPGVIHLLLGMDAQRRDKVEEARQHYEQAFKLSPQTPVVVNNLAWAMAHSDKPDLDQALNLINTVLQRTPNQLRFRETRGQILAKMGKDEEALRDLEIALPVLRGHPALHKTLAEIYRKRGDLGMAAEHERLALPAPSDGSAAPSSEPAKPSGADKPKPADPKTGNEEKKPSPDK